MMSLVAISTADDDVVGGGEVAHDAEADAAGASRDDGDGAGLLGAHPQSLRARMPWGTGRS